MNTNNPRTTSHKLRATQETYFGFESIPREEKTARVRGVFDAVASRYDIMNDVMSLGLHRAWKNTLVNMLRPTPSMHVLDVAGGTGDVAQRIFERAQRQCKVTVCDINPLMVAEGRNRAIDANLLHNIDWVCANAESLPIAERAMEAYTIAFGIRNVTDIPAALREAYRVLKPGGRFLCLEFTNLEDENIPPPSSPRMRGETKWGEPLSPRETFKKAYDWYSFTIIPQMGKMIAGDSAPYRYLVESIRRFPPPAVFSTMIEEAGFYQVTRRSLNGGIVSIHSGWRI